MNLLRNWQIHELTYRIMKARACSEREAIVLLARFMQEFDRSMLGGDVAQENKSELTISTSHK